MKILVIAAHPDDEILGLGGTLLKHADLQDEISVCIVTKTYPPEWTNEYHAIKKKEAEKVDKLLQISKRIYLDFRTVELNCLPHGKITKEIQKVIEEINPDVVYTHFGGDLNKDHQIVFESVMVATRPISKKMDLICFETPSSTEWNNISFNPNFYVEIGAYIEKKIAAFAVYESEVKKYPHPRSKESIRILAQKRGIEISCEFAEAFKIVRKYWT